MTLQQLLGELQTLALAYPGETPVMVEWHEQVPQIIAINVRSDSTDGSLTVFIGTQ